jgi:hypothetical protein
MNESLLQTLIDRKLINGNTEIDIWYHRLDLSGKSNIPVNGTFMVCNIGSKDNHPVISGRSVVDGSISRFVNDQIIAIDGMDPERFASIYNIGPDGGPMKQKKKRGRKPKDWKPEDDIIEVSNAFQDDEEEDDNDNEMDLDGDLEPENVEIYG